MYRYLSNLFFFFFLALIIIPIILISSSLEQFLGFKTSSDSLVVTASFVVSHYLLKYFIYTMPISFNNYELIFCFFIFSFQSLCKYSNCTTSITTTSTRLSLHYGNNKCNAYGAPTQLENLSSISLYGSGLSKEFLELTQYRVISHCSRSITSIV